MADGTDQLFREIIPAFPADFARLVIPRVARQLDLTALDFRREEYFTPSPRSGRPRRPDLAAKVPTLDGSDVLLHVEIESRFRTARLPRLCEYNQLLTLYWKCPVHTQVVYCRGGPPGVRRNVYRVRSLGRTLSTFHYDSLGLSGASAEEYLARPERLAWAFAALMRPGALGSRADLRLACLRRIVGARELRENQRFLLFNFVATVIESDRGLAEEYDELFKRARNQEVREEMMTWADKMKAKGREEGREEGLREGRQQGMQDLVLGLLEQRFTPLPKRVARKIRAIDSTTRLTELAKKAPVAKSLAEMGLA